MIHDKRRRLAIAAIRLAFLLLLYARVCLYIYQFVSLYSSLYQFVLFS